MKPTHLWIKLHLNKQMQQQALRLEMRSKFPLVYFFPNLDCLDFYFCDYVYDALLEFLFFQTNQVDYMGLFY